MEKVAKKYEELVITDDFMFGKVFRNPERCRKLLEIILGVKVRADDSLPMRSRYYQSVIDINLLEKGAEYRELRKSYLIFICAFDPFDRGRHIYHFGTLCLEDPSIRLMDGAERIFLNTKGTMEDVDEGLRNLLRYFGSLISQGSWRLRSWLLGSTGNGGRNI